MKRQLMLLSLVGFVSFLSGGWLLQRGQQGGGQSVYDKARLFDQILSHVADYYVDSLDERDLYDLAIDGMLEGLDDPYTSFLREENLRNLTRSTTGNYGGLGIRIEVRDGWITIITPLPDTPAETAGLRAGDRIVQVDGRSTEGWNSQKAVEELTGEPGTRVKILVARAGISEALPFTIERAQIHVNSVETATILDSDVGYLSLTSVSESSAQEMSDAINTLHAEGAKEIVLDLRNNPGGILNEGVGVADLFLDPGAVVVETRGRAPGTTQTYRATRAESWPGSPLIVLVNELSASAAEIIAGALQDHHRAVIVGTPTFGKGVAQHVFRLNAREALRITTSRWYTPDGTSIDRLRPGSDRVVAVAEDADSADGPVAAAGVEDQDGEISSGGIAPDVLVRPDTLTTAEQQFVQALGSQVPIYQDVLTAYALDIKGRGSITDPGFQVSGEMTAEVLRRMRERGVKLDDADWAKGDQLVSSQLGYQIARYVFGRDAEVRRRAGEDAQVRRALSLLQQANTQEELLQVAAAGD